MGKWDEPAANIGVYDITTGQWRPATPGEQARGLAERERRKRASRNSFVKTAILGTAGVLAGGYGLAALAGPTAAVAPVGTGPGFGGPAVGLEALGTGSGYGGPALGSVVPSVGKGMAGIGVDNWIDIGGRTINAGMQYAGQRGANASNDRAAQLLYESTLAQQQIEREKMAEDARQAKLREDAERRNFDIAQEERMENMRRLEEKELQYEPYRVAKEAGYRDYMKRYYGIDVGPTVARTPRQFGITPGTEATSTPAAGSLAAQAQPGAGYAATITPQDALPQAALLPQQDPWFIQNQSNSAMQSRRPYQADY